MSEVLPPSSQELTPKERKQGSLSSREIQTIWISRFWLGVPLLVILVGIVAGSGSLIGLAVLLVLAGFVARLWSRHALDHIIYERIIPETRAFYGEGFRVTLRLLNDKLLPVPWLEIRDSFPEGLLEDETRLSPASFPNYVYLSRSTHLSWYEQVQWTLKFDAPERGYYRLGPAQLQSGDLFGFFPVRQDEEIYDSIIVYPRLYTLPELGLPPRRPFGERKGHERIFEDPARIAGARDYRPGDPMKRIDWKASARSQNLQSKVYEPSNTPHLLIALNVHTMEHSWQGFFPDVLERLLSAAGSVARYAFEAGYSVGIAANGSYPTSDRPLRVPVGRSSDQLLKILESLAVIGPLTLVPLQTVLDREAQAFPFGATLVCVTSRMDSPLAASLLRIAGAGHAVTVLSLADQEFDSDLGTIPVFNLSSTMKSLEARHSAEAVQSPS